MPKCSQTWDFPDFIFIISNGVEDDAVLMIYVAMANKPVSPTDNLPHRRTTFLTRKYINTKGVYYLQQTKSFSTNNTSQINV